MRFALLVSLLLGLAATAQAASGDMRVYSYIAPPARPLLQKADLSDKEIERYAAEGLKERSIGPINDNQLYEGSGDALRVDLRKQPKGLVIGLSVRQGASVHNMLQRWEGKKTLRLNQGAPQKKLRSDILDAISALMEELKSKYNSAAYKEGSMMEE